MQRASFRFVRFYTLEEAENAVREKNLKVIGNKQINVELSSSTRRDLQANSDGEGRCVVQRCTSNSSIYSLVE